MTILNSLNKIKTSKLKSVKVTPKLLSKIGHLSMPEKFLQKTSKILTTNDLNNSTVSLLYKIFIFMFIYSSLSNRIFTRFHLNIIYILQSIELLVLELI